MRGPLWRAPLHAHVVRGRAALHPSDGRGELVRDRDGRTLIGAIALRRHMARACTDSATAARTTKGSCLRGTTPAPSRCAGFAAASKTDGALASRRLPRRRSRHRSPIKPPIRLDLPRHALSDCAFGAPGGPAEDVLIVTTNVYGGSKTYIVDEGTGALTTVEVSSLPNNEAVAIDHDGALYEFMDGNTSVSPYLPRDLPRLAVAPRRRHHDARPRRPCRRAHQRARPCASAAARSTET